MLDRHFLKKIFTKYILLRSKFVCSSHFNKQDFTVTLENVIQSKRVGDITVFDAIINDNYFSFKAKADSNWADIQIEGHFHQSSGGTEINLTVQNGSFLKYLNYSIKIGISIMGLIIFISTKWDDYSLKDSFDVFIFTSIFILFPKLLLSYTFKTATKEFRKAIRIISITEV